MGATLGKGLVFLVTKGNDQALAACVMTVVAIYSAVGLRDEETGNKLGKAMMTGPGRWQAVKRLRRDPHEPSESCWLHGQTFCLSQ